MLEEIFADDGGRRCRSAEEERAGGGVGVTESDNLARFHLLARLCSRFAKSRSEERIVVHSLLDQIDESRRSGGHRDRELMLTKLQQRRRNDGVGFGLPMTFEPSLEQIEDPQSYRSSLDRGPLGDLLRRHLRRRGEGVSLVERFGELRRSGEISEAQEERIGEGRIDCRVVQCHSFDQSGKRSAGQVSIAIERDLLC